MLNFSSYFSQLKKLLDILQTITAKTRSKTDEVPGYRFFLFFSK